MEDKLTQEVAQIIERILAGKDAEEQRARTEEALRDSASTIESLTSELKAATEQNEDLTAKLDELEAAKEEFEKAKAEETDAAKAAEEETAKKIEDLETQLAEKTEELDGIQKDAVAASRMAELESAGVVREDKEAQSAKVREMNDEEFASYKEELESVRATVVAQLEKAKPADDEVTDEEKAKAEAEAKAKEEADAAAAAAEGDDDEGVVTPPAEINPAHAAMAALNSEIFPPADMVAQYNELGNKLAEAMKKDK